MQYLRLTDNFIDFWALARVRGEVEMGRDLGTMRQVSTQLGRHGTILDSTKQSLVLVVAG